MPRHPPTPWHRLFGIALTDLFTGRPWRVELELELALKSQRLDVLIIERLSGQAADLRDSAALADLPDGLEGLGAHNILTYKSAQESLDAWAVDELIGHYVTYRKLVSEPPAPGLLARTVTPCPPRPAGDCSRPLIFGSTPSPPANPRGSCADSTPTASHATAWPGVYDLTWGHRAIRLIVLNRIADHPRNAPWQLFASELERVRSGLEPLPAV
ncbi:hypothetical protein [Thiocapsa sp.]|uniref:hypothetical protein n=1 Tax=Thiocapsa sp. TaxID=2024551 RepID=UPI0026310C22|nr:hypothetical protein [Thiocapsa sp.]